jgi:hypothetical protein
MDTDLHFFHLILVLPCVRLHPPPQGDGQGLEEGKGK